MAEPLPAGALDGVSLVLGDANDSCETACSKRKQRCSAPHLKWANSCDRLREVAGCEAGCEALKGGGGGGGGGGGAMPAYVDGGAPKNARPAMCFTAASEAALGCAAKEQHYHRLCSCV